MSKLRKNRNVVDSSMLRCNVEDKLQIHYVRRLLVVCLIASTISHEICFGKGVTSGGTRISDGGGTFW